MILKLVVLAAVCAVAQSGSLSCDQIKAIVDDHNAKRAQVMKGEVPGVPAATNMKQMAWDPELAEKATKWASNNNFAHNPDTSIPSGRFTTGENIYWAGNPDRNAQFNVLDPVNSWHDEYKNYKYGPIDMSDFDGSHNYQIGHFTQVNWAETTLVGCGLSEYMDNGMKNFFFVCNYGPPGNMLGDAPFKIDGAKQDELIKTDAKSLYEGC